jgi:gas vesicle protein
LPEKSCQNAPGTEPKAWAGQYFVQFIITITKKKIMSTGKVLLGVLAGVAAGALLGILFAPEKGTVTRNKMAKKGEDYANTLKDKFNEFLDSIAEKFDAVKEEVTDFAENSKTKPKNSKEDNTVKG